MNVGFTEVNFGGQDYIICKNCKAYKKRDASDAEGLSCPFCENKESASESSVVMEG